jgi:hypothetical protein
MHQITILFTNLGLDIWWSLEHFGHFSMSYLVTVLDSNWVKKQFKNASVTCQLYAGTKTPKFINL